MVDELISFDELYQNYQAYCKTILYVNLHCFIVSKQYFEQFVSSYLSNYVRFDTFVNCDWIYI